MIFLQHVDQWLARLEKGLLVLLLTALLGLGLVQVLLRNLLASGIFWAEELLQHIVLWLGFLGASLATREQRHLRIDVLSRLLPVRWQPWLAVGTNLAASVVCGLLCQAAWTFVRFEQEAGTVLTFGIAAWIAQSIMPWGFLVMALRFARHALDHIGQLRQRQAAA